LCFLFQRGLTLLVASVCAPGIAIPSVAQQEPVLYPVSGVVLNPLTHQPIPRVLVDGSTNAALTDGDGRFEIDLPEGLAQIQVRRPGYDSRGQNLTHAVQIGPNLPALTFYLTPDASITGHVTLSSGDDPDGVRFTAYLRYTANGHQKWRMAGGGSTNTEGVFRIANLETPGVYALCSAPLQDRTMTRTATRTINRALSSGREDASTSVVPPVPTDATGDTGYPSVCYPAPISDSADSANLLAISPGQQLDFELALNRQPFYSVSITVPNAVPGLPVGVQIFDPSGRPLEYTTSWNQQHGAAEVNLPNGQYYAEGRFGGQVSYFGHIDFHVTNAPTQALSMALLPLHSIPVEIHRQFPVNTISEPPQSPNGGFQEQADPGLNLILSSADSVVGDANGGALGPRRGTTDKSLFELSGIVPGRYWVQTTPYQGYVGGITSGSADLTREPLIVGPGNSTAPIQIVLRKDGGEIHCTVNPRQNSSAGPPLGEMSIVFVYAIPESLNGSQIPQTSSQGAGTVVLANLAPGRYRVLALDKYVDIGAAGPTELARLSSLGKSITIEAGGINNIELDVIPVNPDAQEGSTQ
jgi:hypothetical protein